MSRLDQVQRVLNDRFKIENNILTEGGLNIPIKKKRCNYLLYKYDDTSTLRGLAGGLFPFFKDTEGVKIIPDYIMFVEQANRFYVLIIEIKETKEKPTKQIIAGKCFVNYIIETIKRTENQTISPQIRGIGISKFQTNKRTTNIQPANYDRNGYCDHRYNSFLIDFLLN